MFEKLLFTNYSLGSKNTVDVYGIIESQNNLFLKIQYNNKDKEIKIYRLIAWKREDQERIYLHEKTNRFVQIGYFDMSNKSIINLQQERKLYFKQEGKNDLQMLMIFLFSRLIEYMYKQNQWHDIEPVKFHQARDKEDIVVKDVAVKKSQCCPICGQKLRTVVDMGAVGYHCRECDKTF